MDAEGILKIAQGIWVEDLRQRKQDFGRRVRAIHEQCASRGIGRSGVHISLVLDECVKEQRTRAAAARELLERTVSRTGQVVTVRELSSLYSNLISNMYQDITMAYEDVMNVLPVPQDQRPQMMLALNAEGVSTITQQERELELFANSAPQSTTSPVTVIGAYQTGSHATAHVVQHFNSTDSPELAKLTAALRELRAEIEAMGAVSSTSTVPVILDIERELAAPTPRKNVVSGLVTGLAAGVDILGNAPAAWVTVKAVASSLGMHLP